MEIRHAKGVTSRQARTGWPEGTYEDEHGRNGFSGEVSMLYRAHPPTRWTRIEGDLKPRAIDSLAVQPTDQLDPAGIPERILHNSDVHVYVSRRREAMSYYMRNADGDEIYFVHTGRGTVESDYGPLPYETGDYVVVPKGTNYRIVPDVPDNFFLIVESRKGPVTFPDRGLFGQHLPFDFALLQTPDPQPAPDETEPREYELRIKRADRWTRVYHDFCPLDVVGWTGNLSVYKLNVRDLRGPSSERTHLPPISYATFQCPGFWVVTFQPKPFETAPDAVRVPSYHRNVDYDEVVFTHSGRLMSRAADQGAATLTLHPAGIHHGPNPRAFEAAKKLDRMEAYLVNIDSEQPLAWTQAFTDAEDPGYWATFSDQPVRVDGGQA
ncbi:homogentisate 1,2-dioxygenase [Pseudonocardia bannensis]|uniref:Homogentisate 1,2-dioxygenase n=1 Tax=Pseudonocardia bannensis TaxID=630973 RepID=A0A848DJQ6_9PSEU|nr:homogentisate 1,2-dioxygenase [Pseudonocardia bannensis]NMH92674.1 homogentisate 1,2-dioxygenase [Pseudonocardia bannensis]